jgi:hypothetical protein
MTTTKKPHPLVDIINAWADGDQIQYRFKDSGKWIDLTGTPSFDPLTEYRIKPVREYPQSMMPEGAMVQTYRLHSNYPERACKLVANAALRDAIDRHQVVTTDVVEKLARMVAKNTVFTAMQAGVMANSALLEEETKKVFRKALAGEL